jgi:hypothetical protein
MFGSERSRLAGAALLCALFGALGSTSIAACGGSASCLRNSDCGHGLECHDGECIEPPQPAPASAGTGTSDGAAGSTSASGGQATSSSLGGRAGSAGAHAVEAGGSGGFAATPSGSAGVGF